MKQKIRYITETALMLALLVTLQYLTKPLGQLVTGSCVNAVLAVSALVGGLGCGLTVALVSPVLAYLLGIAPVAVTVPAIMAGNAALVVLLQFLYGKGWLRRAVAWLVAAVAKFGMLYLAVNGLICGLLAECLLAAGTLKAPMLQILPVTFGISQLITALIGGGVAVLLVPVLRKALRK